MQINRFGIIAFILFAFQSLLLLQAIDIKQIKETHSILLDEYKHCSPVHGALWVETGLIKNFYNFGREADNTVRLIKLLFYSVPRSFNITQSDNPPAQGLGAQSIGKIVGLLERERSLDTKKEALKPILLKEIFEEDELKRLGAVYSAALYEQFIDILIGSLSESGYFDLGTAGPYAPFTTYAILLGFLYRKVQSKDALKSYFSTLAHTLGRPIFTSGGAKSIAEEKWLKEPYTSDELAGISKKLEEIINEQKKAENATPDKVKEILTTIRYEDVICSEIIQKFYSQSLPKIAEYAYVTMTSLLPTFKGKNVSDCVEMTLRNLCNIVLYDHEHRIFKPEKISTLKESVKKFYASNQDPLNIQAQSVHQAWFDLIQNQPYIAYRKISSLDGQKQAEMPIGTQGFIYFPSGERVKSAQKEEAVSQRVDFNDGTHQDFSSMTIAGKKFVIIDSSAYYAYEIRSSLRNVIILLCDIFGLDLLGDLSTELIRDDFNTVYFVRLCALLNLQPKNLEKLALDRNDFLSEGLSIELMTEASSSAEAKKPGVYINFTGNHTELVAKEESQEVPGYKKLLFSWLLDMLKDPEKSLSIGRKVCINNLCALYAFPACLEAKEFFTSHCFYITIYALNFLDVHERQCLISAILKNNISDLYYLAAKLIEVVPVEYNLAYAEAVFEFLQLRHLTDPDLEKSAKQLFLKVKNSRSFERFRLMLILVEKGLALDIVAAGAQEALASLEECRSVPYDIWVVLIKQNALLDQAIVLTEALSKSTSSILLYGLIFKLWHALFEKDGPIKKLVIERAIKVATESIKSDNISQGRYGLKLWRELLIRKQGFIQADEVVQQLLKSDNEETRLNAQDLQAMIKEFNE